MFSSNQVLEVSGDLSHVEQLEAALEFALKYSGEDKNMLQSEIDRGCRLLYQITDDGKYCIGWGFVNDICGWDNPSGWLEYPFKFDVEIVSKIIKQHLEAFSAREGMLDGSYDKGFIMKHPSGKDYEEIKSAFYCIVYFEPFTCFYAK